MAIIGDYTIKELEKLHPDTIKQFLETGETPVISKRMQKALIQINRAFELIENRKQTIHKAARTLAEEYGLHFNAAKRRVYQAIQMFEIDDMIPNQKWDYYFATRFEDLALLAISQKDLKTAMTCLTQAHELRTKRDQNALPDEIKKPAEILLNPEISPEKLGLQSESVKEILAEGSKLIEKFEIDKETKIQLKKELKRALPE